MKHVVDAADRGVKVRLILDDLTTVLKDDRKLEVRDWQTAMLNAHPNIQLRLFNAFRSRSMGGRALRGDGRGPHGHHRNAVPA
jgi:putative cardiolipin synthase